MEIVILWLFFCVLAGMFAHNKRGRNGINWFVIAFFCSPLVAFLLLVVLNERDGAKGGSERAIGGPAWLLGRSDKRPW
jgi:hypothetical protein